MFKDFVQKQLEGYVRRYFRKYPDIKLIVVAGSVGKTSTKVAIAKVLEKQYKVRVEELNRNAELSAPTSILGVDFPDEQLRNPLAWVKVFAEMQQSINSKDQPEVIVQEIGTEKIGEIPDFARYLKPDLAVITAITPEHMEFFDNDMDVVAKEELAAANMSQEVLINRDDVEKKHLDKYLKNKNVKYYSSEKSADFCLKNVKFSLDKGYTADFILEGDKVPANVHLLGQHSLRLLLAAAAVGKMWGVADEDIAEALEEIRPLPGRMNLLKGKKGSHIIDDSFNSSPAAAEQALNLLYEIPAKKRVVVLGSMKELGKTSKTEHEKLAKLLDPKKIDEVIVTHVDAVRFLAPAAKERGLKVTILPDALEIGEYLEKRLSSGEVLLFKASYGAIWLEEAIKPLLADSADEKLLPRQFEPWLSRKRETFGLRFK